MGIAEAISGLGIGKTLTTFIISMIPVVELRGAIPIGVSMGLTVWQAALISVVGNMLPVPFILVFVRSIFSWLRKKSARLERFVDRMEARASKKADAVRKTEFWGLLLFVAIPLPGTGAWTGALIAAMMDLRMKNALPSIFGGVCAAGVIVSLATAGVVKLLI